MNILFVCHRFPFPPQRGGKIRPFNVIKHLNQNHRVTVASPVRSEEEALFGAGLADYCHSYLTGQVTKTMSIANMAIRVPTSSPFSMGYFYSRHLHEQIRKELARNSFDLIFVHCSSVAQYVEDVNEVPKILDFGDMDSQKWLIYSKVRSFPLNLIFYIEGIRLQQAEKRLAQKFDYCTCTTLAEMKTLQEYHVGARTDWFPNGVDTNYFQISDTPYEPDSLCFIGRMDYFPNQECMFDFCKNTLPLIRAVRPNVTMTIIGADPSLSVRNLGGIPGVTVTGSVDDVRPYVQKCAVNVAPLNIARGTQNKVLESLAMGVPSVLSEQAANGVDGIPGEHFLTASTHRQFAEAILRLLSDDAERQRFSKAGRQRMLSNHNWEASMNKLDSIVERCIAFSDVNRL